MLKEKIVKVFDVEAIKKNSFITYAFTQAGDEGELELAIRRNGLVLEVDETYIKIFNNNFKDFKILLNDVLSDRVRILGIASSVESGVIIR